MIRVIKEGDIRVVDCENCLAILEFEKGDEELGRVGIYELGRYITCPCCRTRIEVPKLIMSISQPIKND